MIVCVCVCVCVCVRLFIYSFFGSGVEGTRINALSTEALLVPAFLPWYTVMVNLRQPSGPDPWPRSNICTERICMKAIDISDESPDWPIKVVHQLEDTTIRLNSRNLTACQIGVIKYTSLWLRTSGNN